MGRYMDQVRDEEGGRVLIGGGEAIGNDNK